MQNMNQDLNDFFNGLAQIDFWGKMRKIKYDENTLQ